MRPHIRRILLLWPPRPPNRFFTQLPRSRPQLPFLSQPQYPRQVRFLTTDRKQWLKDELKQAGKYTAVLWIVTGLLFAIAFGVQQEWLERKFPSPHEWSWVTRKNFRSARWNEDHDDDEASGAPVDWARTGGAYRELLKRLEDPLIDGAGLEDQDEGGILVAGVGKTGYNVMKKSEPWRRGYYEVLIGAARAAEHLDGWVRDRTRNVAFPADVVIGPSNPNPRPVPPGAKSAPREEDCEPAFEPPETYYMRALTTQGFTEKQRLDAALGYAAWLDYKGTPGAAEDMYKWALDIATSSSNNPESLFDTNSGTITISPSAGLVSSNILSATTALAVHHAQVSSLSVALPLLLSILRSRRSLPPEQKPTMRSNLTLDSDTEGEESGFIHNLGASLVSIFSPPKYPHPPGDGTTPPRRDVKERCEEAAVMAYIGEVLYASSITAAPRSDESTRNREDGLAWTREAVDIAEEELRSSMSENTKRPAINREARTTCRQCLETGLGNWAKMVAKMAREERERKQAVGGRRVGGWLGFGGELVKETVDVAGRWESEELVVQERMRRARDVLGTQERPEKSGMFIV